MSHYRQQPTIARALIPKSQNVKVFVRFRPVNSIEKAKSQGQIDRGIAYNSEDSITVPAMAASRGGMINKHYTYDGVLPPKTTQRQAFEAIAIQTCNDILEGYNGTIFVYGMFSLLFAFVSICFFYFFFLCTQIIFFCINLHTK